DSTSARQDRMSEPRNLPPRESQHYVHPSTPIAVDRLSALSPHLRSNSGSPAVNVGTPAESVSNLSVNYQSSEYSDFDDFLRFNFNNFEGGSPAFLDHEFPPLTSNGLLIDQQIFQATADSSHYLPQSAAYLPLSPDKTPSLHTASPNGERKGVGRATFPNLSHDSVAVPELATLAKEFSTSLGSNQPSYQLTPDTSGSGRSSDDGLAPAAVVMPGQSPRVTVSEWEKGDQPMFTSVTTHDDDGEHSDPGASFFIPARDDLGQWVPSQGTGQGGLDPTNRPSTEVPSVNEQANQRKSDERREEVGKWIRHQLDSSGPPPEAPHVQPNDGDDNIPQREFTLGDETENRYVSGQTYYKENGSGEVTQRDIELMHSNRNWGPAPVLFSISNGRHQPQTSQAAMERMEKMYRDTDSVVSRAATWGTRRRSLPSVSDMDIEGITSGSFLKKLTLKGDARRPSLLGNLRGMVRRPSAAAFNKRSRAENDDDASGSSESLPDRRESQTSLAPPARTSSWNKKQSVPSINTAFVAMAHNMASIGATHARSGSISATPITSPKSPNTLSLSVKNPLNRMRSKSDVTKMQATGLADLWKRSGGPPVASLAKPTTNAAEADDDEDDEDDMFDDSDMKADADKIIEDITPNLDGFRQHVLKLNPQLAHTNAYLVDRIAYQQIVRYKHLLNLKVRHLSAVANGRCSCGALCMESGGSANPIDPRGDVRSLDPLSARYDGSDGDVTPMEGMINPDSFPADIPMPPTTSLPAEIECQLCFQPKKFQKPSDWTKHVHEDVQPFTCTWDRCREPKMFKRKADWVRHENEGHRHLEWWTCDVEDCRHVCYRRDNFLQHLVREHKFTEPKVKTKAAVKRAGNLDPTWVRVEQCHEETKLLPSDELCRFCDKSFPTWKKLTVHLAKHMEQISLPILMLVAKKDLEADTIISPVQEPPPRQFPAAFTPTSIKREPHPFDPSPTGSHAPMAGLHHGPMAYSHGRPSHHHHHHQQQQQPYMYSIVPNGYQPALYNTGYENISQSMVPSPMTIQTVGHVGNHSHGGFTALNAHHQQAYAAGLASTLPVTTAGLYMTPYMAVTASDVEPFPVLPMNALGLQDATGGGGGGGMSYNGNSMMDPHSAGPEQFTPQQQPHGSVSPFAHSPQPQ
ncbi:hypothetical protein B0T17DRAFT_455623, partial [Bombardia bombarda]